jgi:hypothetical protein
MTHNNLTQTTNTGSGISACRLCAMTAQDIDIRSLVPPSGDRVPQVNWGPVVHNRSEHELPPPITVVPNFVPRPGRRPQ